MTDNGLIVHCPRCGAALEAIPKVLRAYVTGMFIDLEYEDSRIDHDCQKVATS